MSRGIPLAAIERLKAFHAAFANSHAPATGPETSVASHNYIRNLARAPTPASIDPSSASDFTAGLGEAYRYAEECSDPTTNLAGMFDTCLDKGPIQSIPQSTDTRERPLGRVRPLGISNRQNCCSCSTVSEGSQKDTDSVSTKVGKKARNTIAEHYSDLNAVYNEIIQEAQKCATNCPDQNCFRKLNERYPGVEVLTAVKDNIVEYYEMNQAAAQDFMVNALDGALIVRGGDTASSMDVQRILLGKLCPGLQVCGRVFRALYGLITRNKTWLKCLEQWAKNKQMGFAYLGRCSNGETEGCKAWWRDYAESNGEPQPNQSGDLQIESADWGVVYQNDYVPSMQDQNAIPVPLSTFYKCKAEEFKGDKFTNTCKIYEVSKKGTTAKCNECTENGLAILNAGRNWLQRREYKDKRVIHTASWTAERRKYFQNRREGRAWQKISMSIDGKATWKTYYPYISKQWQSGTTRSFQGSYAINLALTSVIVHGWKTLFFQVPDWVQKTDDGGGCIVGTLILLTFQKLCEAQPWMRHGKPMPSHLTINWDGGSENRNCTAYGFIHHLLAKCHQLGVLETIDITRLPVGHTHNDNDQEFGVIDGYLESATIGSGYKAVTSWSEWTTAAHTALSKHKQGQDEADQKHGNPEFFVLGASLDFHKWLEPCVDSEFGRFASTTDYVGGTFEIGDDGRPINFDPNNLPRLEEFRRAKAFYMQFFVREGKVWHRTAPRINNPEVWWPTGATLDEPISQDESGANVWGYQVLLREPTTSAPVLRRPVIDVGFKEKNAARMKALGDAYQWNHFKWMTKAG